MVTTLYGPVAQGLEQSAHNRSVGGSIPSGPTIIATGKSWSVLAKVNVEVMVAEVNGESGAFPEILHG